MTSLAACVGPQVDVQRTPMQPPASTSAEPTDETEIGAAQSVISVAGVDPDGTTVTVSGYVSGVVEAGGECRFVLTSNINPEDVVRAETLGAMDAANTSCGSIQITMSEFSRGTWSVTLEYTSDHARASSEPVALEIP